MTGKVPKCTEYLSASVKGGVAYVKDVYLCTRESIDMKKKQEQYVEKTIANTSYSDAYYNIKRRDE